MNQVHTSGSNSSLDILWDRLQKQNQAEIEHEQLINNDYSGDPRLKVAASKCHQLFWENMQEVIATAIAHKRSDCYKECEFSICNLRFSIDEDEVGLMPCELYRHLKAHLSCKPKELEIKILKCIVDHFQKMFQETIVDAQQDFENRTGGSITLQISNNSYYNDDGDLDGIWFLLRCDIFETCSLPRPRKYTILPV